MLAQQQARLMEGAIGRTVDGVANNYSTVGIAATNNNSQMDAHGDDQQETYQHHHYMASPAPPVYDTNMPPYRWDIISWYAVDMISYLLESIWYWLVDSGHGLR